MKFTNTLFHSAKLLIPAIILVLISLFTLYSLQVSYATQQSISLVIGLALFYIFTKIDPSIYAVFSKQIYIAIIILLLVLLLIGPEVRGSVRWFDFFGLRIQVSEVIKPFFIASFAHFLTTMKTKSFFNFAKSYLYITPILALILIQPDLGSTIIFLIIASFMIFMFAFPIKYFALSGIVAALPLPFIYSFLLHDYQKARIYSFLNATEDPLGSSYNSIQALISVGSGKIMGKGFGESTQSILQFLPEHHTDFIFASISESLGFVGASLVLAVFGYLLLQIIKLAQSANNEFTQQLMYGIFALFMVHIVFNIGMNLALLPVVGITLPFVSYGGSALVTDFVILGIASAAIKSDKSYNSFEIR